MDMQTAFEQEKKELALRRKECLMRSMATVLASIPIGIADGEGIALRRVLILEGKLDEALALHATLAPNK